MIKKLFIGVLAVLLMTSMAEAREVSGKNIPESMTAGDNSLLLNGAGTRTKMWMSIYAAGLYLPKKMDNSQKIINADIQMAIRLHVISGFLSAKKMENALRAERNGVVSKLNFAAGQSVEVDEVILELE